MQCTERGGGAGFNLERGRGLSGSNSVESFCSLKLTLTLCENEAKGQFSLHKDRNWVETRKIKVYLLSEHKTQFKMHPS